MAWRGAAEGEPSGYQERTVASATGYPIASWRHRMSYELKLFSGNANRPLAEEIAKTLQLPLGDADVSRFSDGEVYVQINENVRGAGRLRDPAHVPAGERSPDGAARDDRRLQARVRPADHRGAALLRLRPAGPQGAAAGADHRQARGRPPHRGRPPAAARGGPPRRADPGLLQHPGGPPLRRAAGDHRLPGEEGPEGPRPGLARRGRRGARPGPRQAAQGGPGHHRQAPRRQQRGGLHAPHRRRQGQGRR